MFVPFFENLRTASIPVSLREYLTFLEGMKSGLVTYDVDGFYYLARAAMVRHPVVGQLQIAQRLAKTCPVRFGA